MVHDRKEVKLLYGSDLICVVSSKITLAGHAEDMEHDVKDVSNPLAGNQFGSKYAIVKEPSVADT